MHHLVPGCGGGHLPAECTAPPLPAFPPPLPLPGQVLQVLLGVAVQVQQVPAQVTVSFRGQDFNKIGFDEKELLGQVRRVGVVLGGGGQDWQVIRCFGSKTSHMFAIKLPAHV